MIGIILCGHGHYASGTYSALALIAGKPQCFEYVDFLQEDSTDDLSAKLKEKVELLKPQCREGIVIFTDMMGTSPYKESVELKGDYIMDYDIEVITGTNVGMLLQMSMARSYIRDMDTFLSTAMDEGRKQIACFEEKEERGEE